MLLPRLGRPLSTSWSSVTVEGACPLVVFTRFEFEQCAARQKDSAMHICFCVEAAPFQQKRSLEREIYQKQYFDAVLTFCLLKAAHHLWEHCQSIKEPLAPLKVLRETWSHRLTGEVQLISIWPSSSDCKSHLESPENYLEASTPSNRHRRIPFGHLGDSQRESTKE